MNKIVRLSGAAMTVGALALSMISTSYADSVSGFLGQPQNPNVYTCFRNANGAVTNICTATNQFCVALPVASATHTVQLNVTAPDISHNVSCFAQAVNSSAGGVGFSGSRSPSVFGSPQILTLPTLNVPPGGGLYACCDMAQSSWLNAINF